MRRVYIFQALIYFGRNTALHGIFSFFLDFIRSDQKDIFFSSNPEEKKMSKSIIHHGTESPPPNRDAKRVSLFWGIDLLNLATEWKLLSGCQVCTGPSLSQGVWSWEHPALWVLTDKEISSSEQIPDYIPCQVHVWEQKEVRGVLC